MAPPSLCCAGKFNSDLRQSTKPWNLPPLFLAFATPHSWPWWIQCLSSPIYISLHLPQRFTFPDSPQSPRAQITWASFLLAKTIFVVLPTLNYYRTSFACRLSVCYQQLIAGKHLDKLNVRLLPRPVERANDLQWGVILLFNFLRCSILLFFHFLLQSRWNSTLFVRFIIGNIPWQISSQTSNWPSCWIVQKKLN